MAKLHPLLAAVPAVVGRPVRRRQGRAPAQPRRLRRDAGGDRAASSSWGRADAVDWLLDFPDAGADEQSADGRAGPLGDRGLSRRASREPPQAAARQDAEERQALLNSSSWRPTARRSAATIGVVAQAHGVRPAPAPGKAHALLARPLHHQRARRAQRVADVAAERDCCARNAAGNFRDVRPADLARPGDAGLPQQPAEPQAASPTRTTPAS